MRPVFYKIDDIGVNVVFCTTSPYVKVFVSDIYTKEQRELINALVYDFRIGYFSFGKKNYYRSKRFLKCLIRLVKNNEFFWLYDESKKLAAPLPLTLLYLFSNKLYVKEINIDTVFNRNSFFYAWDEEDNNFKNWYRKNIERYSELIINNQKFLPMPIFSPLIKYPDHFINDNFKKFNWKNINSIRMQRPKFSTIVEHVQSIRIDDFYKYLDIEQIQSLKLIKNMI